MSRLTIAARRVATLLDERWYGAVSEVDIANELGIPLIVACSSLLHLEKEGVATRLSPDHWQHVSRSNRGDYAFHLNQES